MQGHVVHEAGPVDALDRGRRDGRAVRADDRPGQERRGEVVAEHRHLAGSRVDLGVRGDSGGQAAAEGLGTEGLERGPEPVGALGLGQGEQTAAVPDDVHVGQVADGVGKRRADQFRARPVGVVDPGPQRAACGLLGYQGGCADEPVAVAGGPAAEPHLVHHAIAVERVDVATDGAESRVRAVA